MKRKNKTTLMDALITCRDLLIDSVNYSQNDADTIAAVEMADKVIKKSRKKNRIIVYLDGGVVQDVDIPLEMKNLIEVEIRDYDTDGADEEDKLFEDDGGVYYSAIYE